MSAALTVAVSVLLSLMGAVASAVTAYVGFQLYRLARETSPTGRLWPEHKRRRWDAKAEKWARVVFAAAFVLLAALSMGGTQ